jgi:hypothetical protein
MTMNRNQYYCPICNAHLNPGTKIVLCARHNERKALMLLSPTPGDYDVVVARGLDLETECVVELFCPICDHPLVSARDANMAELVFRNEERQGVVVFSKVWGQHATYFVTEEAVQSYGEHADGDGVNFWGERRGI